MRHLLFASALCATMFWSIPQALADDDDGEEGYGKSDWPLQFVKRPQLLPQGMLELRGDTLRVNLSKGAALDPISLAPDIFYGIKDGWTLGITHDTGICLTGKESGCAKPYNDVGVELQFRLMGRGSFLLAATGGASVASFSDPFVGGLDFGFLTRVRVGKFAVVSHPGIHVGLTQREARGDFLDIPVDLYYQVHPQTAVSIETGFVADLDDVGGNNNIPFGVAGLFAVNEKIDFGAAIGFTNLLGTDGGFDGREIIGRFALRL